ncbi:hypothetical protein BFJ69_g13352 [Fusarium oxysporum]|uniref:Uncharacterized protein n=1 Tax=Fusarium oxysporum TaxID=5507 RepID=A0A420ML25_FUSOX|nr:hypothetical protein BFJ69_g13352 [Fusarium oxysporum]
MLIEIISPPTVRVILRVYFIVFLTATTWLTKKALHCRAKIRVARGNSISVIDNIRADGFELFTASWGLRSLAGGSLSFFTLLLLYCFGHTTDLLTNYLVVGHKIQARCPFNRGLVFDDLKPNRFSQWNGRPVSFLQNAQLFAVNNSCKYGIYKKVDSVTSFCPDDTDIVGSWKCDYTARSIQFAAGTANVTLVNDLYKKGALYQNHYFEQSTMRNLMGSSFNHMVAWSTSASEDSDGTDWDVLAAVQTNWQKDQPVQMDTLKCTLDAPGASNTHRQMASHYDLRGWLPTFQGLMYYGTNTSAVNDVTDQVAMLLNSMVMISGGNNYLLAKPVTGEDQTQGCIKVAAYVPPVMIGLFSFVGGLFLISTFLFFRFLLRLRRIRTDLDLEQAVVKELDSIPQDVLKWAVLAAREHSAGVELRIVPRLNASQDGGRADDSLLNGQEGAPGGTAEESGNLESGSCKPIHSVQLQGKEEPVVTAEDLRYFKIGCSPPIPQVPNYNKHN